MEDLSGPKTLAGIGSLFIVLSVLPYVGFLLGITGWVLLAIGIYKLSKILQREDIFGAFIKGLVINLLGTIGAMVFFMTSMGSLAMMRMDPHEGMNMLGMSFGVAFVVFYLILVASFYFIRKSFSILAEVTNHSTLKTAGSILFFSSLLAIVLIGFLGIFIGWIVATVGFFTLSSGAKNS